MEKIINKRLLWTVEKRNLLITEQSGFQQQRSTVDNILHLESEINESSLKRNCLVVLIDLKRYFLATASCHLETGKPQGSVISHYFITAINDILQGLKLPIKVLLYEDDLIGFSQGNILNNLFSIKQFF